MKRIKSNRHRQRSWWRGRMARSMAIGLAMMLTLLFLGIFSGTALAAEVRGGDTYVLPRGEVIHDDLYVSGGEVIIDGTVEGDLVVAGGFVEVNGVIMGDLLATGGAVIIAGAIQDDVRTVGGAVILSGSVGDDIFAAAGGGWPGSSAIPVQGRNIPQGLQIAAGSTIGGDAYVVGGQGTIAGAVGGNLIAMMGNLAFTGRVAGDADLRGQSLAVGEGAVVQGELRYATESGVTVPESVASSVVELPSVAEIDTEPTRNPIRSFFQWLLRTLLVLAGYLLAGWLVWSFAPRQITGPVAVMSARPMEAGISGLLAVVAVVPVGAVLTFLAILFWGWFPGGAIMATFIFGLVSLLWLFSPLCTGLWVGRKVSEMSGVVEGDLQHLLLGIGVIVLVGRLLIVVPCVGSLFFQVVYLVSLALGVGAWFLAQRGIRHEPPLLPTA